MWQQRGPRMLENKIKKKEECLFQKVGRLKVNEVKKKSLASAQTKGQHFVPENHSCYNYGKVDICQKTTKARGKRERFQ